MALPDGFIQELKMKTDIEDIVSTYVSLKKRGSTFVGLCPFHNEKTPSFTVYPETQSFYCFGCGAGGDAIGFIKRIENLDYIDAVKSLALRVGMQLPDDGFDDSMGKRRRRIYEINRETAKFFHSYMLSEEGKKGLDYFLSRGLSKKTINHFGLGYAPGDWHSLINHLKKLGYSYEDMVLAGVAKRSEKGFYDMFRGRVMTPIIDIRGNVIAFGGRVLDDSKPKYINTGETLVYKKTNELFAMNYAKDSNTNALILCEGYMDVIAMHQAGFTNAVAGCGTALTNEQVKVISRYADEVILCYDNDGPGRTALNRAIELFRNTNLKVRIPALTGGKDPDEILKNQGIDRFKAMLESSSNEIEYKILNLRANYDLKSTQGSIDFINEVIKVLVNADSVERDIYVSRIAEELGVEKESIKAKLNQSLRSRKYNDRRKQQDTVRQDTMRKVASYSSNQSGSAKKRIAEERLVGILIKYPEVRKLCVGFDDSLLSDGYIRKAYVTALRLIDGGFDTDLMNFSQSLTDNEISQLTRLLLNFNKSDNNNKEFTDCMLTIKNESTDTKINAESLDAEDFNALFKKLDKKDNT
jgi:DNA primase